MLCVHEVDAPIHIVDTHALVSWNAALPMRRVVTNEVVHDTRERRVSNRARLRIGGHRHYGELRGFVTQNEMCGRLSEVQCVPGSAGDELNVRWSLAEIRFEREWKLRVARRYFIAR